MSVHPIQSAARKTALVVASAADTPADPQLHQATLLARIVGETLLANVQNTASLNLAAARALLAHARIPKPAILGESSDSWRYAWRSFEICATSADHVLNLTRGHVERTTSALWQAVERITEELAQSQSARVADLRESLEAMRDAQAAYWQATQRAHSDLIALAQTPALERNHGTH